jgi:hypothetical protein
MRVSLWSGRAPVANWDRIACRAAAAADAHSANWWNIDGCGVASTAVYQADSA